MYIFRTCSHSDCSDKRDSEGSQRFDLDSNPRTQLRDIIVDIVELDVFFAFGGTDLHGLR